LNRCRADVSPPIATANLALDATTFGCPLRSCTLVVKEYTEVASHDKRATVSVKETGIRFEPDVEFASISESYIQREAQQKIGLGLSQTDLRILGGCLALFGNWGCVV